MNSPIKPVRLHQICLWGGIVAAVTLQSLATPALSSPKSEITILEDNPKVVIDEMWQIVNNEFVDKEFNRVKWKEKRQELLSRNYANHKQAYKAIQKALKWLGDPYTRFLTPDNFATLTSQTSGEWSGVGVRLTFDKRTSQLYVVEAVRSSPAAKAGIKRGDRINRINGQPTSLMTLEQAIDAVKGELGTDVILELSRGEKEVFVVTLTRSQIEIASVTYNLKQERKLRLGYIRLDEFSSHAAEQMTSAIKDLRNKEVSAYILDLRGNPGGLLLASVDIARLWLKKGEIVMTVDRRGGDRHFSANGTSLTDLPLVVLVDNGSASASEILAGALKENQRATVVGTTTYGKGTVQSVHSLSDGSGLAVTIARYYPPSGKDINQKGIKPDIYIEISEEEHTQLRDDPSLVGTHADPHYRKAVELLGGHAPSVSLPKIPRPVSLRWETLHEVVKDKNPR
ncbi:MAG: carboxyl-terminal processing protease CtpB [cyanobacterium endosymbiont of Rhopalodia musculus]|uniref:carboxyl-terminal processing protease CtpB n=1 Tax=cyanobacterium endosymbiont of Epithemia clementina EcSB TaxID=3034674 RepID=UPI00248041FE|nr:carboxyl-terminal processing protease CtpB [cyanobacterium endosymbiont of Epithemia clementina EcSB]WGT68351.1 S41 family peptidase [cyanobacterium endosymbiont of Epithemia clementina EcSB]